MQKLLFAQDFRSVLLNETHLSVFSEVFSQDCLLFFCYQDIKPFGFSVLAATENESAESVDTNVTL